MNKEEKAAEMARRKEERKQVGVRTVIRVVTLLIDLFAAYRRIKRTEEECISENIVWGSKLSRLCCCLDQLVRGNHGEMPGFIALLAGAPRRVHERDARQQALPPSVRRVLSSSRVRQLVCRPQLRQANKTSQVEERHTEKTQDPEHIRPLLEHLSAH